MGFFDTLFGSSEDPSIQQVETLTPGQKALLGQLTGQQSLLLDAPGQQFQGDIVPGAGQLSQQLQAGAGGLLGQSFGALNQQPLTAQSIQQGSQPFLDALTSQFQGQVVPQIAGQFGALDSARSSGLGQAIGRQASQLPGQAISQFLNQRNTGFQQGLQGLSAGSGIANRQDLLNQLFAQGQFQNFQLGQAGADPRTRNLSLALGSQGFGNIGLPGSQTPGIAGSLGGAFLGTEAGAGAASGLLSGLGGLLGGI